MDAISINPKIPGFKHNWIPGCVVEAMVATYEKGSWADQDEFNQMAKKVGFYGVFEETKQEVIL